MVLILGLGNLLRGDDGVGPQVIEALNECGLPEGVTALDGGTGGLDLLHVLEGWERAIIIDAADVRCEPGQFVRFTPDEARFVASEDTMSLHNAGLAEALALADAVGQPLPDLVIFGVQPAHVGWGERLSRAVKATLPALVDAVIDEVNKFVSRDA
jgi:hydrogenase maturation protease